LISAGGRPGPERPVKRSRFRTRESQLLILLAALRLCDSHARVAATREALKR